MGMLLVGKKLNRRGIIQELGEKFAHKTNKELLDIYNKTAKIKITVEELEGNCECAFCKGYPF